MLALSIIVVVNVTNVYVNFPFKFNLENMAIWLVNHGQLSKLSLDYRTNSPACAIHFRQPVGFFAPLVAWFKFQLIEIICNFIGCVDSRVKKPKQNSWISLYIFLNFIFVCWFYNKYAVFNYNCYLNEYIYIRLQLSFWIHFSDSYSICCFLLRS